MYSTEGGHVLVESNREIALSDVTAEVARESGFDGLVDLLKTARHGRGANVHLIRFRFVDVG
jgi:hypothetical protein